MRKILLAALTLFSLNANAVILPYTFTSGSTIVASEVNANFSALSGAINTHESVANPHSTGLEDILLTSNSCGSTSIDFNLTQAIEFRAENLAADPSFGNYGRLIYNTVENLLKLDNGTAWVTIAGTGVNTLSSVLTSGNSAGANDIDMNNNELLNVRMENLASDPGAAQAGRIFFNTTTTELKLDTGSAITAIGGAQGLASVLSVSNSAGSTNIDFNNKQALNMALHVSGTPPPGPVAGQVYYDSVSTTPQFYNGSSWAEVGNTNTLAEVLAFGNTTSTFDINFNGNEWINARAENLVGTPGSGNPGRIYFETASEQMRYETGTLTKEFASLDDTQTLTNKSMSGAANTFTLIPDSALSSNVSLLNGAQTITAVKTFQTGTAPLIPKIKGGGSSVTGHIVPDIADDTFALLGASQTLTGKTFLGIAFTANADFNLNQAVEFVVENLASEPSAGSAGRMLYKTSTGELMFDNGSFWQTLGVGTIPLWSQVLAAGASAGSTDPDINLRQLLNVRIENGTPLPAAGNSGRLFFNTGDTSMYSDDGSAWDKLSGFTWADVLANGSSAGATNPDFNNRQSLNFRLENLGANPGAAQVGRMFYHTGSAIPKFDTGASIEEFVD